MVLVHSFLVWSFPTKQHYQGTQVGCIFSQFINQLLFCIFVRCTFERTHKLTQTVALLEVFFSFFSFQLQNTRHNLQFFLSLSQSFTPSVGVISTRRDRNLCNTSFEFCTTATTTTTSTAVSVDIIDINQMKAFFCWVSCCFLTFSEKKWTTQTLWQLCFTD